MPNWNIATTYVAEMTQICVTIVSESKMSLRFSLRLALCELQAILRQMHWMTPNDIEHHNMYKITNKCY